MVRSEKRKTRDNENRSANMWGKTVQKNFDTFLRLFTLVSQSNGEKRKRVFFPGVVLDLKENFEDFVVS